MTQLSNAIALTGGIASGKSTVCSLLKLHGFHIIDADTIAHDLLQQEAASVRVLFGDEVMDGKLVSRKKLGAVVFADPNKRRELEALLHPRIRNAILGACQERERFNKPYIVDIPLFYETNAYPIDRVIVIYTPRHLQEARLMARDGLDRQQAQQRLDAQIDIEEKKKRATWIVDNSRDLKHLQREVENLVAQIKDQYGC
ncbi:MAG: dephospho-CoA kinase [Campylobacterales bacterium]